MFAFIGGLAVYKGSRGQLAACLGHRERHGSNQHISTAQRLVVCSIHELLHPPELGAGRPGDVGAEQAEALRPSGRGPSLFGPGCADRGLGGDARL